jgi:hypothetical protein
VRILLCDQKASPERSLLLDIVQHHVLTSEEGPRFTLVTPPTQDPRMPVVLLEDLDEALASTPADVVIALADAIGLERVRTVAQAHGPVEVIAITRGYVMVNLDPAKLAAMLRAIVQTRITEPNPLSAIVALPSTLDA